jgi:Legionella pneumophila major outer membrane protein precursor
MRIYTMGCVLAFSSLIADQNSINTSQNSYPPIPNRNDKAYKPGADLNIDYLYWTAREDGLEYAYDGNQPKGSTATTNVSEGKVYFPDSDWQSGYKIGLAAYTAYDGWDLSGEYTWFKLSTQGHTQSGSPSTLKRTWQISGFSDAWISFATNHWSLDFNSFDLLLRRKFYLSPKFLVQPKLGLKGTWQKQSYMVNYDTTGTITNGHLKMIQKTDGAGLEAGCFLQWYITKPVSVVGNLNISTLWLKSKVHRIDTTENNQEIATNTFNVKQEVSYAAPVIETFLGLSFESSVYKNKIQAIFQAGYEFQIWFDANQFTRTILDANGSLGNLSLQGVTLRGIIEF